MTLYSAIIFGLLIFGFAILFLGVSLMLIAFLNPLRSRKYKLNKMYKSTFSLVVPAHNEEDVIERTILKFLKTKYPEDKKEMIIINDGSSDKTEEIVKKYAYKTIDIDTEKTYYSKKKFNNITLINRKKGIRGKSRALNIGLEYSKNDLLFFIDADVQIESAAFEKASAHFADEEVAAVSGYVAVAKSRSFITQLLDFEYVTGQQMLRRGFNVLEIHYIIPGGCSIIRKSVVDQIEGYHHDTLAEDTDLTWRINTYTRKKIHFDPSIKVIADEPTSFRSLWNQRVRWARGNLEVTWKHRDKFGKSKYGSIVTYGFPFWFASLIIPFAFIISASATILASLAGMNSTLLSTFGMLLGLAFFTSWIAGTIINKGKSWLAGLISPGIPILISIISLLLFSGGIGSFLAYLGYGDVGKIIEILFGSWVLLGIPGTYLSMYIIKKNEKLGTILQVLVFGYWMFLVTVIFEAYLSEIRNKERIWVRTQR